jgi:hypothetical protein
LLAAQRRVDGRLSIFRVEAAAVQNDLRNNAAFLARRLARAGAGSGTVRMKRADDVGKSSMRGLFLPRMDS